MLTQLNEEAIEFDREDKISNSGRIGSIQSLPDSFTIGDAVITASIEQVLEEDSTKSLTSYSLSMGEPGDHQRIRMSDSADNRQAELFAKSNQQNSFLSAREFHTDDSEGYIPSQAVKDMKTFDTTSSATSAVSVLEEPEDELLIDLVKSDKSAELLNLLVEQNDKKIKLSVRNKLFLYTCKFDAVKCATALLEGCEGLEGVSVDITDEGNGRTALHYAAISGSLRCMELLFCKKVKKDNRCQLGKTPLEAALDNLRVNIAWSPVDPVTCLLARIHDQDLSAIKLLIEHTKDLPRFTANLALNGAIEAFGILLVVAGEDIVNTVIKHYSDQEDCTISDLIVRMALFIGSMKDLNHSSEWDSMLVDRPTALRMLELLLLWKPNLNRSTSRPSGMSPTSRAMAPLLQASKAADGAVVSLLLEGGALVNETDLDGNSALHWCLRSSNGEAAARVAWKLVEKGAQITIGNMMHATPVHFAAGQGHLDALKILLARVPSAVHVTSITKDTPLFWAVRSNHANCVRLLLSYGANRNAQNLRKQRPIDVADNSNMRELLEDMGTGQDNLQQMMDAFEDSFITGRSKRAKIRGAVGSEESNLAMHARPFPPKTELCRYFQMGGGCIRGNACFFAHGERELVRINRNPLDEIKAGPTINTEASRQQMCNMEDLGRKLFIGGLSPSVESDDLWDFFEEHFGPVADAVVIGSQSGDHKFISRGFGFVTFKHDDAVAKAVKTHYVVIMGKKVEIKGAVPRYLLQSQELSTSLNSQRVLQSNTCDPAFNALKTSVDSPVQTPELLALCDNVSNGNSLGLSSDVTSITGQSPNGLTELTKSASPEIQPMPLTHGPRPVWLLKLRQWLPKFLTSVSGRLKEGEYYPLSSLKGDFRATCGMELDHLNIGYPKLSDFVRSLHDICRMKIVPVGRGPATHMVLLPISRVIGANSQHSSLIPQSLVDGKRSYADAAIGEHLGDSQHPDFFDSRSHQILQIQGHNQSNKDLRTGMDLKHSFHEEEPCKEDQLGNRLVQSGSPNSFDGGRVRTPSPIGTKPNEIDYNNQPRGMTPPANVDYVSHLMSLLSRPGSESQASIIEAHRACEERKYLQEQHGEFENSPPRWHEQIGLTLPELSGTPEQGGSVRQATSLFEASLGENIPPIGFQSNADLAPMPPNRAGSALVAKNQIPRSSSQHGLGSVAWDTAPVQFKQSAFHTQSTLTETQSRFPQFHEDRFSSIRPARLYFQEPYPAGFTENINMRNGSCDIWESPPRRFPHNEGLTEQVLNLQPPRAPDRFRQMPGQDVYRNNLVTPARPPQWFGPPPVQPVMRPPIFPNFGQVAASPEGSVVCALCLEGRASWISLPCGHQRLCNMCHDAVQNHWMPASRMCFICKAGVERWAKLH